MIKARNLVKGDKVAIVSLSSGIFGEEFCSHEVEIAKKRLEEYGFEVVFMPHTLSGAKYVSEHPEDRAADLKQAILDPEIKAIITAIGGDDTYRTIPYLMDDLEFVEGVKNNPKIFSGFSDTTINHLMFYKLGLKTFYGPCAMIDLAELDGEMLPYTKEHFEKFMKSEESFLIEPSDVWYIDREEFGPEQIGVPRTSVVESRGYEVLNGSGVASGELYGGCIESLYDAMTGGAHKDEKEIIEKYGILPTLDEWKGKMLFIETSELFADEVELKKMLLEFKNRGILEVVSGVLVGKPKNEVFIEEYKDVYKEVFSDLDTPVLYNLNFGHALPRCLIPYGAMCEVDFDNKKVRVLETILEKSDNKVLSRS